MKITHQSFVNSILIIGAYFSFSTPVAAQIIPDPSTGSLILPNGNTIIIHGGTPSGSNLFHSFQDFNIKGEQSAIFINPSQIQNIFSRVTGIKPSSILGTLGVEGNANLFFFNPNGIIFGPNTTLAISGSFFGSTAKGITFADGSEFSTENLSNRQALKTISHPVAFLFKNPGNIDINGSGHTFSSASSFSPLIEQDGATGTTAIPGGTITLIGRNINFNGGVFRALNRKIELAAVERGIVKFDQSNNFDYRQIESFGNINFLAKSAVNASAFGATGLEGGGINFTAEQINLSDSSLILMQNFGEDTLRDININTNLLNMNNNPDLGDINTSIIVQTLGLGNGGNINILSNELSISNGATINTTTFSVNGGNININSNKITVNGISTQNDLSSISTSTFGFGKGGELKIVTEQLKILNAGSVLTLSFGFGDAGNITVDADSIDLSRNNQENILSSQLSSFGFVQGNGGNIFVETDELSLIDGGTLVTGGFAQSSAGNLSINADSIEIKGPNIEVSKLELGEFLNAPERLFSGIIGSGIFLPSPDTSVEILQGKSGDIVINTDHLSISDNGLISNGNVGSGDGGSLKIKSENINLNNFSLISSATNSGNGGDIFISADFISLSQSQILSSSLGQANGNGGNIFIDANETLLIRNNSNISSSAFLGDGGNIFINAGAILQDATSEITANSELGIDGEVQIETLENEEQNNINEPLLLDKKNNAELISSCLNRPNQVNKFVVRGNGGLPDNPYDSIEQIAWLGLDEEVNWSVIQGDGEVPLQANAIIKTNDGRIIAVYMEPDRKEVCSFNIRTSS